MPKSKRIKEVPEDKDPRGWGIRKVPKGRPEKGVEYRVDGRRKAVGPNVGSIKHKFKFGPWWLTLEQKRFVDLVVHGGVFDLSGAYMEAWGFHDRPGACARVAGMLKKNNDVMPAIRDGLLKKDNQDVIEDRLSEILREGSTSDFFKATEIWAKFTGTFAPEKQAIVQVTAEDKDNKLKEIMGLLDMPKENDEEEEC